ncbi:MAG: hypothetical protein ABIN94_06050 [Ferruginibacter sp.]
MSVNLIEAVQTNLNYPPLEKIDPNTQQEAATAAVPFGHRFGQAAIPAILTGLYKYGTTDEGAQKILRVENSTDWADDIFGDRKQEVIEKINTYSSELSGGTEARINDIAAEAIMIIKKNAGSGEMMDVKNFLSGQRNNILLYLPAALQMGDLLNDDTIDDNTNKMEGPISSLMHKIGSAFSNPANEEEARSNQ